MSMLQEGGFARQTRRPIFSLEAEPSRDARRSNVAGHIYQPESATRAVRMEGTSPGLTQVVSPRRRRNSTGSGLCFGPPVCE